MHPEAEAFLAALDADELMKLTADMARGDRLSGGADEAAAFDYAAEILTAAGYEVKRHEYVSLIGFPKRTALRVVAPEEFEIECTSYALTPGTPPGGVSGELVWVGGGGEDELAAADARGKVTLAAGIGTPAKSLAVDKAGVLAALNVDTDHVHELCVSPVWGTPTPETARFLPQTPGVGMALADGERLQALLERGPVTVALEVEPGYEWRPIPVLIADISGPAADDSFVLLSTHIDSWYEGAMDNATGNAVELAIAKLVAERRDQLRRGLRIAFWSGHSHGRYAGSTWYADHHWDEVAAHCVGQIEIDSIGAKGADVVEEGQAMAETYAFGRDVVRFSIDRDLDYQRMARAGDVPPFWGMGVPSLFGTFSLQPLNPDGPADPVASIIGAGKRGGGHGWWWHTAQDTMDKLDPATLLRDARPHALAVWELCTRPVLPYRYAAAAREIRDAIERYGAAGGEHVDLETTLEACDRLIEHLDAFEDRLEQVSEEAQVEVVNGALRQLGRHLIPVNYKEVDRTQHDLAIACEPVPGLAGLTRLAALDPAGSEYRFALAALLRQRNRITVELRAAGEVAARAVRDLG